MKVESRVAPASSMRKLCPNLDREDGLDTVLEVPIPEEMFVGGGGGGGRSSSKHFGTRCTNVMAWMRAQVDHRSASSALGRNAELQLMLGVVGAPLVPIPMPPCHSIIGNGIKEDPIVSSLLSFQIGRKNLS